MSEQEQEERQQDLTSTVASLIAQMQQMKAELDNLKGRTSNHSNSRTQVLPQVASEPEPQPHVSISTTRRKTLTRLGLALLGGAAAATVTGLSVSGAKVTVSSKTLGTSTSKAGALIVPPGAQAPFNSPPNGYNYGVIAAGVSSPLDLNSLPEGNTGVFGTSDYLGLYGSGYIGVKSIGTAAGVSGTGFNGVEGSGTNNGVVGDGPTGVFGEGSSTGVFGYGPITGISGSGGVGGAFINENNSISGSLPASCKVGLIGIAGRDLNLNTVGGGEAFTIGVYGLAPVVNGAKVYAGYFDGNVYVTGSLGAGSKLFRIDHPLDPTNKYLCHTSVESPDMMNIYNGLVTLDAQGTAIVEMPDWFEALNTDFRYQLTCLGEFSPVFVAEKLENGRFKIGGGKPGQEISWQVTGIRQDAFAKAYRSPVEEDKSADDRGTYLHPELFESSVTGGDIC